jgi:hypothetical protein
MTSPQQMQSQVLDYMKQGQQAALDAVTLMTTIWGGGSAKSGAGGGPGGLLTGPAEFIDQVFDFWVQLLEAQRTFAHSWLDAVAPNGLAIGPLVDVSAWTAPATPKTPTSSTPATSTPASTAGLPADEQVSAAASDAVAQAAGLTAAKTRS